MASVEDYRRGLLERIVGDRDETAARTRLHEADADMRNSNLDRDAQREFWRSLRVELEEAKLDADERAQIDAERKDATAQSAVLAAALTAVAAHLARLGRGR